LHHPAFLTVLAEVLSSYSSISEVVVCIDLHYVHVHDVRLVPRGAVGSIKLLLLSGFRVRIIHGQSAFVDLLGLFSSLDLNVDRRLMHVGLLLGFWVSDHRISAGLDLNIVKPAAFGKCFSIVNSVLAGVFLHAVVLRSLYDLILAEVLLVADQFSATLHLSSRFNDSV